MIEIKHGSVTIQLPEGYVMRENAGQLTKLEVSRLIRVPKGVGHLCELTADSVEKVGAKINFPSHITPDSLREAGKKAEKLDALIYDLEVMLNRVRQSALQDKDSAFEWVCQVNDIAKGYGKRNRDVWAIFVAPRDFTQKIRGRRRARLVPAPTEVLPPVTTAKG